MSNSWNALGPNEPKFVDGFWVCKLCSPPNDGCRVSFKDRDLYKVIIHVRGHHRKLKDYHCGIWNCDKSKPTSQQAKNKTIFLSILDPRATPQAYGVRALRFFHQSSHGRRIQARGCRAKEEGDGGERRRRVGGEKNPPVNCLPYVNIEKIKS